MIRTSGRLRKRAKILGAGLGFFCGIGILVALFFLKSFTGDKSQIPAACVCYTHDHVVAFLRRANLPLNHNFFTVRRNQGRDAVFVSPYDTPTGPALIVVSSNGARIVQSPGRVMFMGSAGEIVAWSNDLSEGVQFTNGYFLRLPRFGLFDISCSGNYFIIGEKPSSTWVGLTSDPKARVCISTNILASQVFEDGGKLYVAGDAYISNDSGGWRRSGTCLVLSPKTNAFELIETISFPVAGVMSDISQAGDRIVLKDVREFSSKWWFYDLRTKEARAFGSGDGWCFFMNDDVLNRKVSSPTDETKAE